MPPSPCHGCAPRRRAARVLRRVLPQRALLLLERGDDRGVAVEELDPDAVPPAWANARAATHAALALAAAARGAPPPPPPAVAHNPVAASLVADVDRAVAALRAVEAPLAADDRREADAAVDALEAELDQWPDTWDARRVVLRILRRRAAALRVSVRAWRVAVDGTRFAPPFGAWVDLSQRPTLARLLTAIVDGRRTVADLGAAVWPGERMVGRSLRNRVQVGVSMLRKAGFAVVQTADGGYRIDPGAPIDRVPA